ncbi:histidine phosphatase family protein [Angustibacter sp. McL0619]|uniref:histidine phosphatase family protein n=1 Tax=Angustibacter sp. McL0619 TaxID=3415676 RepID=UPI003CE6E23F
MPTVLLIRHGRTAANASGVLAGWTPGVELDDQGRKQAAALAERLSVLPLAAIVASPLERCQQTAAAITAVPGPKQPNRPEVVSDERIGECHYGDWTGRELKTLVKDPLWNVVQQHPSAVVFPGADGESMRAMQTRALDAVREWDARVAAEHGNDAVWVAVSHGDVIKAVLADALGAHLDQFQRILVSPCSISAVHYSPTRPFVISSNDVGGDLSGMLPPPRKRRSRASDKIAAAASSSDAVVGGGA